ncbi:MAG: hypothetical protein RLZZ592_2660 [Pseudomonadota bacterium]|jgi:hypothetical protein
MFPEIMTAHLFAPARLQARRRRARRLRLLRTILVLGALATTAFARPAWAATDSGPGRAGNTTLLRVHATRSHMHCPLPGRKQRLIGIDSPAEWTDTLEQQGEEAALGRKVRWSRERVIVFAPDMQDRHAEAVRLESPAQMIRVSDGVLYWPVRQRAIDDPAARQMRPCVMAIIDRAFWQRIRVVPARPL